MIGSNVPTVGGLPMGFRYADEWGCQCIQIYVTLSRRWEVPDLTPIEIAKFKDAWGRSAVRKVIAHIPYLVNLASPDNVLWQKSIDRLMTEVSRAQQFGVSCLVLHPGSYGNSNRKEGIQRIIDALDKVHERQDSLSPKILLETMAGQGKAIGSCFEEIALILREVKKPESLGICFDTGHVFMAGYDIRGYQGYKDVMEDFEAIIGLDKIESFHLNDSQTYLGSRNDRHACIGEGELGLQIFHALLKDERFFKIPKILEIPERDKRSKDNLDLLRELGASSGNIAESKKITRQLTLGGMKRNAFRD